MRVQFSGILTPAFLLFTVTFAHAGDIQMLPPVQFNTSPDTPSTACSTSTAGVLVWGGVDASGNGGPINCIPGFTGDAGGNVNIGGTTNMLGNVVIGNANTSSTLDVNGTVKLGSGSCTAAGQLQWNGSSVQYCDGTSWKNLAIGAPCSTTDLANSGYDVPGLWDYPAPTNPVPSGYDVGVSKGNTCTSSDRYVFQCQNGSWFHVSGTETTNCPSGPD